MSREKFQDVNIIFDRLKSELHIQKDVALAKILGIPPGKLGVWRTRNFIPLELLITLCREKNIDIHWLLTGEGHKGEKERSAQVNEGLSKVGVFSLAGAGSPKELTEHEPIESIWLPKEFSTPDLMPVKVRGMSMYPTIWDGAIVGVNKNDRAIISGEIYAIWIPYEGAVIKRLYMDVDKVILKSDNQAFPEMSIAYKELEAAHGDNFILGRVKWIIQKLQ